MIKELMHDPIFLAGKSEIATKEDLPIAHDLLDTLMAHKETCVGMAANMIVWICMGSSLAFCAAFNWLFAWQDDFFLGFFSDVPMVHHFGAIRMHIVLACQFIASSYEIAGSSLRGMGKSLTPAVLTVFGTCLLRIVWVYGVSPVWRGYDVLMMVYPVSWVVTGLLVLTAYWLFIRKKRLALN